jgi:alpha-glucosidase
VVAEGGHLPDLSQELRRFQRRWRGDLPGVESRLDYLSDLGIDAIWLSPIYPSPMRDGGYDISDYRGIDPVFGSMADFDRLLDKAHGAGIRLLMDLVVNHTSDRHPWFIESRSSRDARRRDWYIWRDGRGRRPPNNWMSVFGGRAWEWDPLTGQYYLHSFVKEQPDLNWRNPEVKEAIFGEMRFWLDRGVDGFRLDVCNLYLKDALFRSNPLAIGRTPRAYDMQKHIHDADQPEMHGLLGELRRMVDSYPEKTMVGEVMTKEGGDARASASYLGDGADELHMTFDFTLLTLPWDPARIFRQVESWYGLIPGGGWPTVVFSNHDRPRSFGRYGSRNRREKARLLAMLLLTLRGTPFIYYGEEIGMSDGTVPRSRIQDPAGLRYWPLFKGRDPCRTPMQWNAGKNAGFSTGTPWIPVADSRGACNVEDESRDPSSLLNFYKRLISLRRENPCLAVGTWSPLYRGENGIIGYERAAEGRSMAIILNMSSTPGTVLFDTTRYRSVILSTSSAALRLAEGRVHLEPFQGAILTPD